MSDDKELRKFTREVLKRLQKLPYYTWTHAYQDVVIDGFSMRFANIYPSFSTSSSSSEEDDSSLSDGS